MWPSLQVGQSHIQIFTTKVLLSHNLEAQAVLQTQEFLIIRLHQGLRIFHEIQVLQELQAVLDQRFFREIQPKLDLQAAADLQAEQEAQVILQINLVPLLNSPMVVLQM